MQLRVADHTDRKLNAMSGYLTVTDHRVFSRVLH
jgi:hypothetical protein